MKKFDSKIGLITNVKPGENSIEYDKCPFEMNYIKSGGKSITNIYISDNTGDWYRES